MDLKRKERGVIKLIKMFATDLDNTFLYKSKASKKNIQAAKKIIDRGVELVLASGRHWKSLSRLAKEYGLKANIIGSNGAQFLDAESASLESSNIGLEKLKALISYSESKNFYYFFYDKDGLYAKYLDLRIVGHLMTIEDDKIDFHLDMNISKDPYERIEKRKSNINKMMIVTKNKDIEETESFIEKLGLAFTRGGSGMIEIMEAGSSKFSALEKLLEKHNLKRENLCAIGDFDNDFEMIKGAGIGIAMGNANDRIKKIADYITADVKEDGFAKAVDYLIERGEI